MFKYARKYHEPIYEGDGGSGGAGGTGSGGDGGTGGGSAGGTGSAVSGAGGGSDGGAGGGTGAVFTQDQVNSMMAKQKRELQEKNTSLMSEIEALQTKQNLTTDEKKRLEKANADLRKANMTAEQLKQEAENKLRTDFESQIEGLKTDVDTWKSRHTEATISRAIIDAAASSDAYVPKQVLAILKPQTRLVEATDDDGKPTGEFIPTVTFHDTKEGKPVTLELSPEDAVKRMSEMDEFLNLFKGKGSGGIGGSNRGGNGGGKMTAAEAAVHFKNNPAGYKEWREKNSL